MPTTLSRSPPQSHPRALHQSSKSPSKIPLAYPAPYRTSTHAGSSPPQYYSSGSSLASTSAVPSLVSDYGSSAASSVNGGGMSDGDLLDMLDIKLSHSIKSEPLDRGLARQAQA